MRQYCSQKHPLYVIRGRVAENRFFSFGSSRTLMTWTLTQYTLKKKKCGVWGQQTWLSYVTWAGKSSLHKAKLTWRRGRWGEGGSQQVYNDQMYQMYKYQMHYQWGRKWNRLQLLVTHSRSPVHFCFHSSTWNKASVVFTCNRVKLKFKFPWTARRK